MIERGYAHEMSASIIASEGGAGYYPENTAYAVQKSLAEGVQGCELDFHLTKDKIFVANHDYLLNPAITRTTAGGWLAEPGPAINQTNLADLHEFDFGSLDPSSKLARKYPLRESRSPQYIATFQDIEEVYAGAVNAELWFEAKTDPYDKTNTTPANLYVEALAQMLATSPLFSRTVLIAFDWSLLQSAQEYLPGIQTGFLSIDFSWLSRGNSVPTEDPKVARWFGNFNPVDYGGCVAQAAAAANATYWSPYFRDLNKDLVKQAHDLGVKVSTWGADTSQEIDQALNTGVDSLTTGYVDRARSDSIHND